MTLADASLTVGDLITVIKDAGTIGVLVLALVGGQRGWFVYGWVHQQMRGEYRERIAALEAENAQLRQIATQGMNAAEKVATKRPPRTSGGS